MIFENEKELLTELYGVTSREELGSVIDDTCHSYETDELPPRTPEDEEFDRMLAQKYDLKFEEDEPEDAHIGYELGDKARMEYINEKPITVVCPKCGNAPEYKLRQDGWNEISCECGFVWNESKF